MQAKRFFASLWEKLKKALTRNVGLKVISLVFAILLWAYVLVVLNPVRTKNISDVPISLEGYNDLLSRNLIVVDQDLGMADVSVNAEITNHASLDASRITCRASLSTITGAGTFRLPVSATVQGNLGSVSEVYPSTVTVEVDKLVKKTVPVRVVYSGFLPDGYEVLSESYSNTISVEGAARFVENAVRAVATIDLTDRTADISETVKVVFYNADGEEIDVVTRTGDAPSVLVYVSISAVKKVPVAPQLNLLDEEYYDVSTQSKPDYVYIYGDVEVLNTVDEVLTENVVLTEEAGIQSLDTTIILPEGTSLKSGQTSKVKLTVTVTEKEGEKEIQVPLKIKGLSDGFHLGENIPATVTVIARGKMKELSKLGAENITATADLTGRIVGVHEITPVLELVTMTGYESIALELKEPTVKMEIIEGQQ